MLATWSLLAPTNVTTKKAAMTPTDANCGWQYFMNKSASARNNAVAFYPGVYRGTTTCDGSLSSAGTLASIFHSHNHPAHRTIHRTIFHGSIIVKGTESSMDWNLGIIIIYFFIVFHHNTLFSMFGPT